MLATALNNYQGIQFSPYIYFLLTVWCLELTESNIQITFSQLPREMLTEQECSHITQFKVIKAFTITGYDSQLWHLAAIQTTLFSKTRKWGGKERENLFHSLEFELSQLYVKTLKSPCFNPLILKFEENIGWSICKWPGNWAAHEAWLMCLLPPPHPWTTNGSSFAELCLPKAFEMNACKSL